MTNPSNRQGLSRGGAVGSAASRQSRLRRAVEAAKPHLVSQRYLVEGLEPRTLFNVPPLVWIGPSGGDFNVAANWSGGVVPTAANDITVPGSTVINHLGNIADSVNSITTTGGGDSLNITAGSLTFGSLTLGGSLTLSGTTSWTSGTISGGTLTNTGTLSIPAGAPELGLSNTTLANSGTVTDSAANFLDVNNGSVINNQPGGIFDFPNSGSSSFNELRTTSSGSEGAFNNSGTVSKSAGNAPTFFSVLFNNAASGIIDLHDSTLALQDGGASTGGTFKVANGAVLDLTGGSTTNSFTGTYSGSLASGGGSVQLDSGTLNIGTAGATFNFPSGLFQWSGGTIGGGTLTNPSTGYITVPAGSSQVVLDNATLANSGTVSAGSNTLLVNDGSTIDNQTGGLFDFPNNSYNNDVETTSGTGAFINSGTVQTESLNTVISIPYNSPGTTELNNTGLTITGTVTQVQGTTLTAGTWLLNGGDAELSINSAGAIATNNATIALTGADSAFNNLDDSLVSNTGTLSLLSSAALDAPGAVTNSGALTVGTASNLDVSGAYTQTSTGSLTVLIGGTPASGGFGTLTAKGLSLAGTFVGHLANGFIPSPGAQYTLIDDTGASAVSGTFSGLPQAATVNVDGAPFTISYAAGPVGNNVALTQIGVYWTGNAGTTDWDTAGNWSDNKVPAGADDVTIPTGVTITHNASNADSVHSIVCGTGDSISLANGSITILAAPPAPAASNTLNNFSITGGSLGVDAATSLTGTNGQFISGSVTGGSTLTNAGTFTLSGSSNKLLLDTILENKGTIIHNQGELALNGSTVQNDSSGTYNFENSAADGDIDIIDTGGTDAFNNSGTVNVSVGGANVELGTGVAFNNAAAASIIISAPAATPADLLLAGGGTDAGGNFTVDGGDTLDMTDGSNPTFTGTYTGSGGGTVLLQNGVLSVGSAGATFDFPQSMFQWTGGELDSGGPTAINTLLNTGCITIAGGSNKLLLDATLENQGTIIHDEGELLLNGATIQNDSTGLYDFENTTTDGDVHIADGGGTDAFDNLLGGTVAKSSGAGNAIFDSGVNYSSLGTTEVDAASLQVIGTALPQVTGSTLTGGTWVGNDATLSTPATPTITTIGAGASVTLNGPASSWSSIAAAVPTTVTSVAGGFSLLQGRSVSDSASLTNTGAVTIGTGSTANSGSNLTTAGAYTQATGALTLLIGGTPASGEFGTIAAAGVTLGGTLTAHLANGFSANPGDQYTLINNTGTSPVSGTFSGLPEGAPINVDGTQFTISYAAGPGGNDVALTVGAIVPSMPTHLVFLAQPTNTQTHGVVAPVQVAVEDASNHVVTTDSSIVTIAVNLGPNTLQTLSAQAVAGVATFSGLSIGSSNTFTLRATDGGLTSAKSNTFIVAPGSLASLSFQQQPVGATSGAAISPAVTVKATDSLGNFIANAPVTLTVASGPGALTTGSVTAMTNSIGIATFGGLVLTTPGGYTLVAMDGSVSSAVSNPFTVKPAVGVATQLAFLQQPTDAQTHGTVAPVMVAVEDANKLVVTTDTSIVTITVNLGSITLQTLSAQAVAGVATFSGLSIGSPNTYTLEATDGGLASVQSNPFRIGPGPLAKLSFQQQPVSMTAGAAISPAVTVKATDDLGNFIANAPVTLAVASGPGLLTGTVTVLTNSSGIASFSNLLLLTPGNYTLAASDGPVSSAASNPFAAIGPANHLAFLQQPANAQTHGLVAPVTVAVEDANNNVVITDTSSVSIAVDFSSTTLQTLSMQAVAGIATFSSLSIGSSKTYYLEATDGGLTSAQSNPFTVAPGPVASLSFQQQPVGVISGIAISPAVTVKATDSLGNLIANAPVTLTVASGPGALTGTVTALTNSSGIASFSNLLLITPGSYMLAAQDGAVSSPASNPFTVSSSMHGLSAHFSGAIPASAKPGTVILPALRITDAAHAAKVVNGAESTVYYLSVTPTLSGILSKPLATNHYVLNLGAGGVHTESQSVTIPAVGLSGTYYLVAQIDSTRAIDPADRAIFVASGPITISTVSSLIFVHQPTKVAAGKPITPAVTVKALDSAGKAVAGATVTLIQYSGPGPLYAGSTTSAYSTVTGYTAVTNSAGIATFSSVELGVAGTYTLIAKAGQRTVSSAPSASFSVLGALSASALAQRPATALNALDTRL